MTTMPLKRSAYLVLSLTVLGAIAWLGLDIAESIHERKQASMRIHPLPDVELVRLGGDRINLAASAPRGTVLLFFSTTCPYCRDEIADLVYQSGLFDQARVILLSGESRDVLRRFEKDLGIEDATPFVVALDEGHALARKFSIRRIPAAFIYTPDGMLVDRYDGLVRAETIAAALPVPNNPMRQAKRHEPSGYEMIGARRNVRSEN